jgi:hypothetical protein
MRLENADKLAWLRKLEDTPEGQIAAFLQEHPGKLFCIETVTGLIDYGSSRASRDMFYEAMEDPDIVFADGCAIITRGKEPSGRLAVLLLGGGVVWGFLVARRFVVLSNT